MRTATIQPQQLKTGRTISMSSFVLSMLVGIMASAAIAFAAGYISSIYVFDNVRGTVRADILSLSKDLTSQKQ